MKPQEERNERLAKTVIKNLQRRHMEGFYCPTAEEAAKKVSELFDLRPAAIIRDLKLTQPMYEETAKYGHVGRTNEVVTKTFFDSDGNTYTREVELFTWEKLDRVEKVREEFGIER